MMKKVNCYNFYCHLNRTNIWLAPSDLGGHCILNVAQNNLQKPLKLLFYSGLQKKRKAWRMVQFLKWFLSFKEHKKDEDAT